MFIYSLHLNPAIFCRTLIQGRIYVGRIYVGRFYVGSSAELGAVPGILDNAVI